MACTFSNSTTNTLMLITGNGLQGFARSSCNYQSSVTPRGCSARGGNHVTEAEQVTIMKCAAPDVVKIGDNGTRREARAGGGSGPGLRVWPRSSAAASKIDSRRNKWIRTTLTTPAGSSSSATFCRSQLAEIYHSVSARASSSSSQSSSLSSPAGSTAKRSSRCVRCGQLYRHDENGPTSCSFHGYMAGDRGLLSLAPPHQGIDGDWTDESGVIVYKWKPEDERRSTGPSNWKMRWTCCGIYGEDAPPCRKGPHVSYDDGHTMY